MYGEGRWLRIFVESRYNLPDPPIVLCSVLVIPPPPSTLIGSQLTVNFQKPPLYNLLETNEPPVRTPLKTT